MLGRKKTKLLYGVTGIVLRTFSTTPQIGASHYDILGVTPKATQSDIKSAYYELSKLYHPDTSKDEESAKKFRAITAAYEVLGNIKLKKMYDKGLLVGRENTSHMDYHQSDDKSNDPIVEFYKSRQTRNVVPTMDGKTPIYDFDSWSRNHYGDLFKKTQYEKQYVQNKFRKQQNVSEAQNQELAMYLTIFVTTLFFGFVLYGKTDYDQNDMKEKSSTTSKN